MNMLIINRSFIERWCKEYDQRTKGTSDQIEETAILNWLAKHGQPRFLNKEYFVRLGRWKTPRYQATRETNDEKDIIETTRSAYLGKNDIEKLNILKRLKGVDIAVASTILYYLQPDNFAIFDYHVRNTLKKARKLSEGKEDDSDEVWLEYTQIIHELSSLYNKTPREVEKALFAYDKWGCGENDGNSEAEGEKMDQDKGLTVPLPPDKMQQLETLARQYGQEPEVLASIWVIDQLLQRDIPMPSQMEKPITTPIMFPKERRPTIPIDLPALNLIKGSYFEGKINDERNKDKEGWQRRSIGVPYDKSRGYPEVRDTITMIDINGNKYESEFTKSLIPNTVCLGKSSRLKGWYTTHYPYEKVENDDVYFELTGIGREFRIYTSKEWHNRGDKVEESPINS